MRLKFDKTIRRKSVSREDTMCRLLQLIPCIAAIFLICFINFSIPCHASKRNNLKLLRRVHTYAVTLDTSHVAMVSYSYGRATVRVERRNPILMLVPTAYVIAHGKEREFTSEVYSRMNVKSHDDYESEPLIRLSTIPHMRRTMNNFAKYVTPNIYDETIIGNTVLSPFHPNNFRFYSYHVDVIHGDVVELRFRPKRKNTQLVRGTASIDKLTGRIIRCSFMGEYDMIRSWVSLELGKKGYASLFPTKCEALFWFRFMGNKVSAHYTANYDLPQVLQENFLTERDVPKDEKPNYMSKVRPDTLPTLEQNIYRRKLTRDIESKYRAALDTTPKKKNLAKDILWDAIGDNVLNRIKTNFGQNNQGYIRVNPILNPLYMGYDHRRGFTYKFDIRGSYLLGKNSEINGRLKAGYAFRLHQFYFRLPIYYYFNRRRNGYVKLEVGNGNHIRSQAIVRDMKKEQPLLPGPFELMDTTALNEFRQGDMRLIFNFDLSRHWSIQVGALYQGKEAVHHRAFSDFGWESVYRSFAPAAELQYRPLGWNGPILSVDYDRGLKGVLKSNSGYERMEFNAEYIHQINRLQSLQMRAGGGFYTMRGRRAYFLNYENFRENNIPGGWNDDWSGEFELLRSDNYNNSDYYARFNLTYESPLLLLSWLPLVGHYMEMERIYVSALEARNAHPYIELGYGFTTRAVSVGLFASNGKGNRSVGCKFGFELFRHW